MRSDNWNIFDFSIIAFALMELALTSVTGADSSGFSVTYHAYPYTYDFVSIHTPISV